MANVKEHHKIITSDDTFSYAETLISRGGTVDGFFTLGCHAALSGDLDGVVRMVGRLKGQEIDPESGWYLVNSLINACGPEENLASTHWYSLDATLQTRNAANALMSFWLFCEAHRCAAAEY